MEAWPQILLPYGLSPLHYRMQMTGEKFAVLPIGCKRWHAPSLKELSQLSSISMSNSIASTMHVATGKSSKKTPRDTQGKRKHREKEKEKNGVKTRAKKRSDNTTPANTENEWTMERDQLPDSEGEDEDEDAGMTDANRYVVPS
jgi:hypothetical protein